MFNPPRCPYKECEYHRAPVDPFFVHKGSYFARCRSHLVPRFKCKGCRRTFSRQTFRVDYRDHRPALNGQLFKHLASGLGLRQCARLLKISPRCCELKFRKIARALHCLHRNLSRSFFLGQEASFLLDELETYETDRSLRPVTVPVAIEKESRFIVGTESGAIPPRGQFTPTRRRRLAREEAREGKRPNESSVKVLRVLLRAARLSQKSKSITLLCDKKSTYPGLASLAFGRKRVKVEQVSSQNVRNAQNPLFPINLTNAQLRDLNGRLRRRSWLVSKKRRYLRLQLSLFTCYRNYQKRRFNKDWMTPAQRLGMLDKALGFEQMLQWRQDWGMRSIGVTEDDD